MTSYLNKQRPPVYCPGCSHEHIVKALDNAFQKLNLPAHRIVIVSDIGCSGLFDTFFKTHTFHGLHGRALTYAVGLKLARPTLKVVVIMGDGGLGIGGAHFLSACRKNIDLTLVVLNNFNYGMTGGQFSSTTPSQSQSASGFLNRLEKPMDVCQVAQSAGAAYVKRTSAYSKKISEEIISAIEFDGFSFMDIWGICPGRYTKNNRLTPKMIDEQLAELPPANGLIKENIRKEYTKGYEEFSSGLAPPPMPDIIAAKYRPCISARKEILILGAAGQRIVTAAQLICIAGLSAGLHATQKTDYPITVLRGHSIGEIVLSPTPIGFTGIVSPDVILILDEAGIKRRETILNLAGPETLVVKPIALPLFPTRAKVLSIDFKQLKLNRYHWALYTLAVIAAMERIITMKMLKRALEIRFKGDKLNDALSVIDRCECKKLLESRIKTGNIKAESSEK